MTATTNWAPDQQQGQLLLGQAGPSLASEDDVFPSDANQPPNEPSSLPTASLEQPMTDISNFYKEAIFDMRIVHFSYPNLPALEQMQPALNHYFKNMNSAMPIFSETDFTSMLQEYLMSKNQRSRSVWAALDLGSRDAQVANYVSNAQSVLAEVITGTATLLNLQIVVGLLAMSYTMKDPNAAVMLVGTAVRLAHRLRFHTRDDLETQSAEDSLQQVRVFWIIYIFDKDTCLRYHTPSLMAEADIGLDLPRDNPPDNVGYIYTKDRRTGLHYLKARIRLSNLQGRVYELLFAIKANKIAETGRRKRVTILHQRLELWRRSIPAQMQADAVISHVGEEGLFWICLLHFSYLGCLVMIHGIWTHDAEWRERLTRSFSTTDSSAIADEAHQAQVIEQPLAETVKDDFQLIDFAINVLDRMSDVSTVMQMKRMNVAASELASRARRAVLGAQNASLTGWQTSLSASQSLYSLAYEMVESSQHSTDDLQWDWGSAGVEAWPQMDVSLR
ncbi:hypothetical protein PWT90_10417 [Aphanocladium album]|nr:hypothetical protein PWT90_10417 [Aphanocladium album]